MTNNECNISECDIYQAIKIIKGRWVLVIINKLKNNSKTFSTIQKEFSFLTNTQLTRTLKEMKENNLIEIIDNKYTLTNKGNDLIPIIKQIEEWNKKYNSNKNDTSQTSLNKV